MHVCVSWATCFYTYLEYTSSIWGSPCIEQIVFPCAHKPLPYKGQQTLLVISTNWNDHLLQMEHNIKVTEPENPFKKILLRGYKYTKTGGMLKDAKGCLRIERGRLSANSENICPIETPTDSKKSCLVSSSIETKQRCQLLRLHHCGEI